MTTSVQITKEMHIRIKLRAAKQNIKLYKWVNNALESVLRNENDLMFELKDCTDVSELKVALDKFVETNDKLTKFLLEK